MQIQFNCSFGAAFRFRSEPAKPTHHPSVFRQADRPQNLNSSFRRQEVEQGKKSSPKPLLLHGIYDGNGEFSDFGLRGRPNESRNP